MTTCITFTQALRLARTQIHATYHFPRNNGGHGKYQPRYFFMFALTRTHTFGRIKVPRKDHINSKSDVSNSLSLSLSLSHTLSRSSRLSRLDLAS